MSTEFVPQHTRVSAANLSGNGGVGRYVFLPGSDGRAKAIADRFDRLEVFDHPRGHNLYTGTIAGTDGSAPVDVAVISTGMGTPSVDIILHELFAAGARRFLRVGTSGSLQRDWLAPGALVVATGAVRDEDTSRRYVPPEVPAVASPEMVSAARAEAASAGAGRPVEFGLVHSKSSLFAREFGAGPMAEENRRYMQQLSEAGVLASEMEAAHLFVLASLFDHEVRSRARTGGPKENGPGVLAGAVLAVIGEHEGQDDALGNAATVDAAIDLGFGTVRRIAAHEDC